jgi:hypothetical protein
VENNAVYGILVKILGNILFNKVNKEDKSAATILVEFLKNSKTD